MKYILLTLDAIEYIAAIRQYQNADYPEAESLYQLLLGNADVFSNEHLCICKNADGIILYTEAIDRNNGLLFDFTTFHAFQTQNKEKSITIFQKIIKYAIKYFNKLSLAPCEKELPNGEMTIIYPFPFTATKNVYKVLVDRNSSKHKREGKNTLIVYYDGTEGEKKSTKVSYTALNKALKSIGEIIIQHKSKDNECEAEGYKSTQLENIELNLSSNIGCENWEEYLTNTQKTFVKKPITGVERLEGSAGTGKTLSMILRCIYLLKQSEHRRIIFVTHSKATRDHIIDVFINNWPRSKDLLCTSEDVNKPLLITTLQEWCIKFLGVYLADTEYLDKDASESKLQQLFYIDEAATLVKKNDWDTYKHLCSAKFREYMESTDSYALVEMLQYEIATIIKGRADSNLDNYLKIDRPLYAIPCENEYDLHYLFMIYREYQSRLEKDGKYDSDDIILTALGQLNTPIWKRRRNIEGFQVCFIDETHLFNINELSIFHFLNQDESKNNIIFAIDKSQHIGERAILDDTMYSILKISTVQQANSSYNIIFRSSSDIIQLAYVVLSSGSAIFDHMENPLIDTSFVMTKAEEAKCIPPQYNLLPTDDEMIREAFEQADNYAKTYDISRSKILIACTSDDLLNRVRKFATESHKACSVIKSRGDVAAISSAYSMHQYVVGEIDYIGGLEFDYVIMVGVDDRRVPPKSKDEAFHFMSYAWYNRMYVAITRARYAILMLGNKGYGASSMLESAVSNHYIKTNFSDEILI